MQNASSSIHLLRRERIEAPHESCTVTTALEARAARAVGNTHARSSKSMKYVADERKQHHHARVQMHAGRACLLLACKLTSSTMRGAAADERRLRHCHVLSVARVARARVDSVDKANATVQTTHQHSRPRARYFAQLFASVRAGDRISTVIANCR